MSFNHENLTVYQRTLSFNSTVSRWTIQWDSKHAICDQLLRAAGSILENIAMASATYSAMKVRGLEYALGSCLECAACLDLACIKKLITQNELNSNKDELSQIFRMMMGLRRSWSNSSMSLKEEQREYSTKPIKSETISNAKPFFHHETLDIYQVAIGTASSLCSSASVAGLPTPLFRRMDELLTSILLNIAEGNGRFSCSDQSRFMGTTHESSIKLAAKLDLYVIQDLIPEESVKIWKTSLERIALMASSLIANNQER